MILPFGQNDRYNVRQQVQSISVILPFGQNDGYNVRQQVQSISVILPYVTNDTGVGWVEEGNPTSPGYVADIRYAIAFYPRYKNLSISKIINLMCNLDKYIYIYI